MSHAKAVANNAPPNTLEGYSILHQFFRIKRDRLRRLPAADVAAMIEEAKTVVATMHDREDGDSALFAQLGHKGDLIAIHFRRTLDELQEAQRTLAQLVLGDFLEQSHSYVSIVEIGLYEATVQLHAALVQRGVAPNSPEWRAANEAELLEQRAKLASRLWGKIPDRHYVCFYPMNKRRQGADNWYMLSIEDRQRLMHEHGMIGRRYAGQVNQVISGSIGFDDWEWGVDLFADDPLVFKRLVYEMRFDESSARYGEFGQFFVGIRLDPARLGELIAVPNRS